MDPDLSRFSEWALALLPRLFLYPGGLFAMLAWAALRYASTGMRGLGPRQLAHAITRLNLPAALAWVALALLPLPGARTLPFPADTVAVVGLLITSLAVGLSGLTGERELVSRPALSATVALVASVLATVVSGDTLLGHGSTGVGGQAVQWVALGAGVAGLCVLAREAAAEFSAGLRWLGWLGLLAYPLFAQPFAGNFFAVCLVYLAGAATAWCYARVAAGVLDRAGASICWGLSALALLLAVG